MDNELRTITKRLRLKKSEWEKIEQKLLEQNLTFSEFCLSSMLSRQLTKTPITKELLLELCRQGNNLNQIAKKLNQGESIDRTALLILNQATQELEKIFKILNSEAK